MKRVLYFALAVAGVACGRAQAPKDKALSPTAFVKWLVSAMTLEEKIEQLHGVSEGSTYRVVQGLPRLGIPPLRITNGPAGVGPGGGGPQVRATALPAPIALAATWDPIVAREYGRLAGAEAKSFGFDLLESPDVNIVRVPQGGRTFESFSEDPWLNSRIAVADIMGIQSAGVMANVKHYLANNQEIERGSINAIVSPRTLHEIYMPTFKAAVQEAHVDSIMCAYPRVNGTFNCENRFTLTDSLKRDWGFDGFVMSDFGAVHSAAGSMLSGLDLELPTGQYFSGALMKAVESGEVPVERIDDALTRRLTKMVERGLFEEGKGKRLHATPVPILQHGEMARRISEQSMVLLKNEDHLLPLRSDSIDRIALIGPFAVRAMTGGGGSSYVNPFYTIRPEDGIYSHMRSQKQLTVLDGSDLEMAVAASQKAQVVIVMVGDEEGEDHDHSLSLPDQQNRLVSAVAAANPKTIVVLKSGSAVLMPWLSSVPVVLEAWYPGEEDGNAVADVLFGDAEPGGRLPITFPARAEDTLSRRPDQYPGLDGKLQYREDLLVGYRDYARTGIEPQFPFGFGLSYTTFNYSKFKVSKIGSGPASRINISVCVTNSGQRAGSDVAQIYLAFPPIAEGNEPIQLKAFQKVELQPGESRIVELTLGRESLSYWSEIEQGWKRAQGDFRIMLGTSSRDIHETSMLTMP